MGFKLDILLFAVVISAMVGYFVYEGEIKQKLNVDEKRDLLQYEVEKTLEYVGIMPATIHEETQTQPEQPEVKHITEKPFDANL
jgi:hypothetical protein